MATLTQVGNGWEVKSGLKDPYLNVIRHDPPAQAKFALNCPAGDVELIAALGFEQVELDQIQAELKSLQPELCP